MSRKIDLAHGLCFGVAKHAYLSPYVYITLLKNILNKESKTTLQAPRKSPQKSGLARASGIVAAMTLASRILGMLRDMVIAFVFGAGFATDAFFVAFKIPNLLRRLVAEGSLATAFVPLFSDELAKSHEDALLALRQVATFTFLLTVCLTIIGMFFAAELTAFFAPGFIANPEKFELARKLLVVMFPYVVLVSTLALASGVLNTLGVFAWPAAAPAILNVCLIGAVLIFGDSFEPKVMVLAYGVLLGGVCALVPQIVSLKNFGFSIRFSNPSAAPVVRKLGRLMLPSVVSASVYQLMVFINTVLASLLQEGSVSWLYYADRLFQFPLGVFSIAVGTALLPALSRAAANDDQNEFVSNLKRAFSWVSYITIPASVGLILLARPLASSIYFRGSFSENDLLQTSAALCAFAVGLWSISCHTILVRCYLAKKNTSLPALVACLSIGINFVLALCLMGPPLDGETSNASSLILAIQSYLPTYHFGHLGLALSGSLASFFNFYILLVLLRKVSVSLPLRSILRDAISSIIASIIMGLVLINLPTFSSVHIVLTLLLKVILGVITYLSITNLLRIPAALELLSLVKQQIQRN
jgi:putative peptidoglycan lipid II flippase